MNYIVGRSQAAIFAALGTIVVLWQMLLPGYVLTLDMVFGPAHVLPGLTVTGISNGLPLQLVLYGAGFLVPMWAVEKILLISLFFALFYLPLRFPPFNLTWYPARYVAAALYAVNPFVYERFLAGHWAVLCGYALLAPFLFFLLKLAHTPTRRVALSMAVVVLLASVFSLHVFTMCMLILVVVIGALALWNLFTRNRAKALHIAEQGILALATIVIVSCYWLVPLALHPQSSPVESFGQANWEAYTTAADPLLGAGGNVVLLYGIWSEGYYQMHQFLSPKDFPTATLPSLLVLSVLVVTGIASALRKREYRCAAITLIAIAAAAFVFSVGIADGPLHSFNLWLFEHVSFWRGFRDTQKWSMLIALSYSLFAALGVSAIASTVRPRLRWGVLVLAILSVLLYTSPMLGGFDGQLRSVQYPEEWYEINAQLSQDPQCRAVFLPWHQYYTLSFNGDILTGNTAPAFFNCDIVSGRAAELANVPDAGATDPVYEAIAQAVTDNSPRDNAASIAALRKEGIHYVIVTSDLGNADIFKYPFLADPSLSTLSESTVGNETVVLLKL